MVYTFHIRENAKFHDGKPVTAEDVVYSWERAASPELDSLLEQARVEVDVTKRISMYQQAEQMIVDDAPVLFTTHSLSYQLVQPCVKGFVFTPITIPIERYMWLDGK